MTSYNKQSGALTVNLEITFQAKKTLTDVNLALFFFKREQLRQNWEQLQNTPQLIYMSLNKNSVYCVMPRSSKPPDTCK